MNKQRFFHSLLASAMLSIAMFAGAAYDVRMVGIVFDPGADSADITDTITGDESVMYRFRPKEGQTLRVRLDADNDHTDFIVYAPGKWPGLVLHDTEESGRFEYEGRVGQTGFHAVSVFQGEDAVAEGRTSGYELVIEVTGEADQAR